MRDIEQMKKQGAINQLRDTINADISAITNKCFHNYISCGKYTKLGEAISDTRDFLNEIERLLKALQELQPDNN